MKLDEKYSITGMSCAACSARVQQAVSKLKGIKEVNVSLEKDEATITSNKEIKDKDIEKVITKAGYKVVK